MPDHAIALGARYSLEEMSEPMQVLSAWYANADGMLGRLRGRLQARKLKAPAVRCWPHHFDLDSLVGLGRGRTTGLGFSPGDEYCGEPYFYVTMYPEPSIPGLPLLPAIGHWHTHEFLAAFALHTRLWLRPTRRCSSKCSKTPRSRPRCTHCARRRNRLRY